MRFVGLGLGVAGSGEFEQLTDLCQRVPRIPRGDAGAVGFPASGGAIAVLEIGQD
jgi:hypothetical protein